VILYLDTSTLVKLYVREKNSQETQELVHEAEVVATSQVAYVEARAAFARKLREHGLTRRENRSVIEGLDRDWETYFAVNVSYELIRTAGEFAETHALKAFDAIHLASAVLVRGQVNQSVTFYCFDHRLASAAEKQGLEIPT